MQAAAGMKICDGTCSNGRWDSDRSLSDLEVEVKERKKVHDNLYVSDFIQ